MNHKKIRRKKSFLIPKVKNCKGTLSLHRSKYTACIATLQFTVIKGYYVDYPCGYAKCLPISRLSQIYELFIKF